MCGLPGEQGFLKKSTFKGGVKRKMLKKVISNRKYNPEEPENRLTQKKPVIEPDRRMQDPFILVSQMIE